VSALIDKYFRHIEKKAVVPDSVSKFGYFGTHYILLLPKGLTPSSGRASLPTFFELQIKTLFQHAWSEANHDLGYKPLEKPLTPEQERLLAFASAQAWGADKVFDSLLSGGSAVV
jgi:ppGpp synthetase/RelA/SpoT-type nucleotidyltranferase